MNYLKFEFYHKRVQIQRKKLKKINQNENRQMSRKEKDWWSACSSLAKFRLFRSKWYFIKTPNIKRNILTQSWFFGLYFESSVLIYLSGFYNFWRGLINFNFSFLFIPFITLLFWRLLGWTYFSHSLKLFHFVFLTSFFLIFAFLRVFRS